MPFAAQPQPVVEPEATGVESSVSSGFVGVQSARARPAGFSSRVTLADVEFPLTGPSIELRPFTLDDVASVHAVYSDPQVMRWVGHGPVGSIAGTESIVRQFMSHQNAHGFGFWAVVDRASGELMGDAGLARAASGEVEMGYTLATKWWGRGRATEAGSLCVAAARGPLRLTRLRALVEAPNLASRNVLRKLGFTQTDVALAFNREHLVYRLDLSKGVPTP